MDIANETGGIVLGTGDLSELALGWCTYNGDHMSNYCVNSNIPKTLVKSLIRYESNKYEGVFKETLDSILDTIISPELLPLDAKGNIAQSSEASLKGSYTLHDFFIYHALTCGYTPTKIYTMACRAFADDFAPEVIKKWLRTFHWRFFTQQFKRNCMPDGAKTGDVSLGTRSDWRMPSDGCGKLWIKEAENL